MSEEKSIRLGAAIREFNVGAQHIIDFLKSKGFVVENKPTAKLSEDMYHVLIKEYSKDKVLKEKADQVNIGLARKVDKDEETIIAKTKEEEIPVKLKTETPPKEIKKEPEHEKEIIKTKKVKVEQPKVLDKIELETPEKKIKAKEKKEAAQKEKSSAEIKEKTKKSKKEKEKTEDEEIKIITEQKTEQTAVEQPAAEKKIEEDNIPLTQRKKITLEGPKIMGKIELKEERKPEKRKENAHDAERRDKKKRKRIRKHEKINFEKIKEEQRQEERKQKDRELDKRKQPLVDPEEQQRLIQEQVRSTLAKLSGGKGRSQKSKFRKLKREEAELESVETIDNSILHVAEFTSLSELASLMNIAATDLIQKCFDLGMMVSINQRLDAEIIELLAEEFGFKVQFINATTAEDAEEVVVEDEKLLQHRPPIVTIMGHVDHGKTSLLDYIREANVVAGEKGGITQHIGAYEVMLANGKKIAFLDTPGHEAFTAMRARGAKLTDIAVIVVAADDQVMPQTKEAISHAQAAGVPMVFAINKIDRPTANAEKIKEQLSQMNILVEDWGGKFQSQEISAKSGLNVDTLLEKILLEAELLELKANPEKHALGTIIEASLDKGRGYVSNLMVQEGTLEIGDMVVAGPYFGRVKAMFNERNQKVKNAGPSTPVLVLGLNGAPQAGEKIKVYEDEDEAKTVANKRMQILREQGIRTKKHITLEEIGRRKALGSFRELNIIIKADVDGSAEALTDSLFKLSTPEIQVNVIFKGVGQITETDIMLASASDAIIVGFQVRPSSSVRKLAEKEGVEIRLYSIIYNAIEEVKAAMEGMLAPKVEEKITCIVEVREVFHISKVGTIAGCYVQEGKITRNTKVRIVRDGIVIHTGTLASLKRFKDDVKEVTSGMECGLNFTNFNDIKTADIIEGYEEVEVKRTL